MRNALLAALVLPLLVLSTPALAQTPPPDPDQLHPVSWSALKYEISKHRVVVGPSRDTGYGKLIITGLSRIAGTHRYRATYKVVNVGPPRSTMSTAARSTCWPWESGTIFGCASPFKPATWNWKHMWDGVVAKSKESLPISPLTYDKEQKCAKGAIRAGSYGTATKIGVGMMLGQKLAQATPSPAAWAIGMIGGCLAKMWW